MNKLIVDNLYEFWTYIGELNNSIIVNNKFSYVKIKQSAWPNRIYNFTTAAINFNEIILGIKDKTLPNAIVVDNPKMIPKNPELVLFLEQQNMALNLNKYNKSPVNDILIKIVKTTEDANNFAETASASFNYRVNKELIYSLTHNPNKVKLFNAVIGNQFSGCGIIFFDSNNNAGLHMIGTKPEGRGKGIGKAITAKMLNEAKTSGSSYCVLHASAMGQLIYEKLGFESYGKLKSYKLNQ